MQHGFPPNGMPNQQTSQPPLTEKQKEAAAWRGHQIRDIYTKRFGTLSEWSRILSYDPVNFPLEAAEIERIKKMDEENANKTGKPMFVALGAASIGKLPPGIYKNGYSKDGDKDLKKFNILVDLDGSIRPTPPRTSSTLRKKGFSEVMDFIAMQGSDTLKVKLGGEMHHEHLNHFLHLHKKELFMMLKLAERKGMALNLTEPNTRFVINRLSKTAQDRIARIALALEQNVAAQRMMSSAGNSKIFEDLGNQLTQNTNKDYQAVDTEIRNATADKKPDLLKAQLDDLGKRLEATSTARDEVRKALNAQQNIIDNPASAMAKRIETLHKRGFWKRNWKALKENLAFKTEEDRMKKYANDVKTPEGAYEKVSEVRKQSDGFQDKLLAADLKELKAIEERLTSLRQQVQAIPETPTPDPKRAELVKQVQTLTESLNKNMGERSERQQPKNENNLTMIDPLKLLNENVKINLNNRYNPQANRNPGP